MRSQNNKNRKMIKFLILICVVAALITGSTAAHEDIDKTEEK